MTAVICHVKALSPSDSPERRQNRGGREDDPRQNVDVERNGTSRYRVGHGHVRGNDGNQDDEDLRQGKQRHLSRTETVDATRREIQ